MIPRYALFWNFMQRTIILPKHEVGTVQTNARKISVGRPEGQTSWERRCRWKKKEIKMDISGTGREDMPFFLSGLRKR
jgi:hypothetical protein